MSFATTIENISSAFSFNNELGRFVPHRSQNSSLLICAFRYRMETSANEMKLFVFCSRVLRFRCWFSCSKQRCSSQKCVRQRNGTRSSEWRLFKSCILRVLVLFGAFIGSSRFKMRYLDLCYRIPQGRTLSFVQASPNCERY